MKSTLMLVLLGTLFLTAGCSNMQPGEYRNAQPQLELEDYFTGRLQAWGMFQDRNGRVKRQFTVAIVGTMKDGELVLQEDFVYRDGERDQRIWRIRRVGDHQYVGRADDVIGIARGEQYGNALNWHYDLQLEVRGKTYQVHLNDWMFLQDERVMINRAVMSKWGIRLGEITLVFIKTQGAGQ